MNVVNALKTGGSVIILRCLLISGLSLCSAFSAAQTIEDYVGPRGLDEAQRTAMVSHPDPDLIHNLATHNFKAISDERWSRFNQFQVYLVISDRGRIHPDVPCFSRKLLEEAGLRHTGESAALASGIATDFSYFLREPAASTPTNTNLDSGLLVFSSRNTVEYKTYSAMIAEKGCSSKEVAAVLAGLLDLYIERSSIIVKSVGSAAPPSPVPALAAMGNDPDGWRNAALTILQAHGDRQLIANLGPDVDQFTFYARRHDREQMARIAAGWASPARIFADQCKTIEQNCADATVVQEIYQRMLEASAAK